MKNSLHYTLMVVLVAVLCSACRSGQSEWTKRSDYYTRGIGLYPGSPAEDPSPELVPDAETYRNIALRRTAYHSSSYDYNLTSQLITDGVVATQEPQYLHLTTHEGEVRLREREWTLDGGPFSKNTLKGEEAYIQYGLKNWTEKVDRITFAGTVAYDDKAAGAGYRIALMGSNDGSEWVELGALEGRGLPGRAGRHVVQTDPNKQTEQIEYHTRTLEEQIALKNVAPYSYYRFAMKMAGAVEWTFTAVDFFCGGEQVGLMPSKHFTSAWMSASADEEWVMVDLGSRSAFDKIRLHWITRPAEGQIQTSDDGKTWNDLASLPAANGSVDEIASKGKGRYVRVMMSGGDKNYILSEVEVWGRGGLVAKPKVQPAAEGEKYALMGGGWTLQRS
ncbi:MAG: discoidin domain-containing protein, partial [Alistipes sp.]|nr:discoidin domain-containing protein [Alistipes sp.]